MAEFQEVMKQWRRMCEPIGVYERRKCLLVHAFDIPNCESCYDYVLEDPAQTEKIVMTWAAEHPEPVYPTWAEWLNLMGLIKHDTGHFCVLMPNQYSYKVKEVDILNEVAYKPIPADKAQKLGIEPMKTENAACGKDYCELE